MIVKGTIKRFTWDIYWWSTGTKRRLNISGLVVFSVHSVHMHCSSRYRQWLIKIETLQFASWQSVLEFAKR